MLTKKYPEDFEGGSPKSPKIGPERKIQTAITRNQKQISSLFKLRLETFRED